MSNAYVYKSVEELVAFLGHDATKSAAEDFFSKRFCSVKEVVHKGVTGNTFRAFPNLPVRPSEAFREWAIDYVDQKPPKPDDLLDSVSYAKYVHEATMSLCSHWQDITSSEMGYGRAAKLFNLVLKNYVCLDSLPENQRKHLITLLHVPLDQYTIIGLSEVAQEFSIPSNATMNFVKTKEQYDKFQKKIMVLAAQAQVPAIYYDVLAWDLSHGALKFEAEQIASQ